MSIGATVSFDERQNNTAEQVTDYLASALAIVEGLDPPDDLRQTCCEQAIRLLAEKQIIATQHQSPVGLPAMTIPRNGGRH